jgi:hypothetical protein
MVASGARPAAVRQAGNRVMLNAAGVSSLSLCAICRSQGGGTRDACSSSGATAREERFRTPASVRRARPVCHKGIRYGTTAPEAEGFPAGFQALAVAKVRAFRWQSVTA